LLRRLRPSPAMVVALIALFLSLGGVSYGLATGFIDSREIQDNTIQSRDIRQNVIRTEDLRNNEIRGRDIRNSTVRTEDVALNSLTGADINESSLGKVAAATKADSATTAASATSADSVEALKTVPPTTVPEGSSATLLTAQPFTLTGTCESAGITDTRARVRLATTEAGSAYSTGGDPSGDSSNGNFGPGTVTVVALDDSPGSGPQILNPVALGDVSAFTMGESGLSGNIVAWADASGGTSGVCKFHGYAVLSG